VPGLTDAGRPLDAEDRALLERHLIARLKNNGTNAAAFVPAFDAAARQIWTSFVVEQMNEAFDDATWSKLTKMFSFALRGAIMAFLPWGEVVEVLGEAVAGAIEKAMEFALESGAEEMQHHGQESGVKSRGAQLNALAKTISMELGPKLAAALKPLADGEFYRDWLAQAPLSELAKFRLPFLIPALDDGRLRLTLADLMGGFAHAQKPKSDDNQVEVEVSATENGVVGRPRALFTGSETLGRELKGHPVRTIHHIPIKIRVIGGIPMYTLLGYMRSREVADMENAYAGSGMVITISDGQITTLGQRGEPNGGLDAHLYMARLANPGLDLAGLITRYEEKMTHKVSPEYTPKRAAADLHRELRPLVLNGMKVFIRDEVDPLWILTDGH